MAKIKDKIQYSCNSCGNVTPKWSGKCEACGEWNSIAEHKLVASPTGVKYDESNKGIEFSSLSQKVQKAERLPSGIAELDRVLGGGFVSASTILLGGNPGIGKSTLILQIAAFLDSFGQSVLYVTGEESEEQIKLRAHRLGLENADIKLATSTCINDILASAKKSGAKYLFIDSIQTMYVKEIEAVPGTVSQVRISAFELIRHAKDFGITIIIIGHVTKDGQIAGPKVLEHMVDTVLYFESDNSSQYRILRSIKNRYGNINEIGVFEMQSNGLREVTNPSEMFVDKNSGNQVGSAIFPSLEGTRPILSEVQTLVTDSYMAAPRRNVVGWDNNRLAMLLAVLNKKTKLNFADKEVYLNVAGGLKITDPAADLAVIAALISSIKETPMPKGSAFFGEITLSGETRQASFYKERLKELVKMGFDKIYMPKPNSDNKKAVNFNGVDVSFVSNLHELLEII